MKDTISKTIPCANCGGQIRILELHNIPEYCSYCSDESYEEPIIDVINDNDETDFVGDTNHNFIAKDIDFIGEKTVDFIGSPINFIED